MNTTKASKAGQNHAELVRAGAVNAVTAVTDTARRAYSVAKPVVKQGVVATGEGAKKLGSTVAERASVARSYAGSFLRTLFARSGR